MEEVSLPLYIIVTNRRDDHIGISTIRENALSESIPDNRTTGAAGFPETANKSRLGRPGQAGSLRSIGPPVALIGLHDFDFG